MMYASVRGVDGSVVSLGAVDLTAPDGLGKLVANAKVACSGRDCAVPGGGGLMPSAAAMVAARQASAAARAGAQAAAAAAPMSCRFRVPVRTAAGLQWGWRTMPCPPGITPGDYVRVQSGR
jgi:hypothetical protein